MHNSEICMYISLILMWIMLFLEILTKNELFFILWCFCVIGNVVSLIIFVNRNK